MAEQVIIWALDANGEKPVAEVTFTVSSVGLQEPLTATTDNDGRATVVLPAPGRYDFALANVAPKYRMSSAATKTVEVSGGQSAEVRFHLEQLGTLRARVVSRVNGSPPLPVPNASIVVRVSTGAEPSASKTTGDDGCAEFLLAAGTYWVEHPSPVTGYLPGSADPRQISLVAGATKETEFTDVPLGSVVVRVLSDDAKSLPGASILVLRENEPQRQVKTGDDGTVRLELGAGPYSVRQEPPPPPAHLLPAEAALTQAVVVSPGDPATVEFRNPRAAAIVVKGVLEGSPSTVVAGGTYAIKANDETTTCQLTTGADGTASVNTLAAGTYTVSQQTPPLAHEGTGPASHEVALAVGGSQTVTFQYKTSPPPSGRKWGPILSTAIVIGLLGCSLITSMQGHLDLAAASFVLALGLALLTILDKKDLGFFGPLVGEDNRASTSKTQLGIWTLAVVWGLAFLTAHAVLEQSAPVDCPRISTKPPAPLTLTERVQCVLPEARWSDYLILLGGPFAAAVLAKGFVSSRVNNGTLQKTVDTDQQAKVAEVLKNDENRTDLVDSQYLLFNVVALAYFIGALASTPELPEMPPALLAMTSGAAALYSANKAVTSNKPVITGVSPATVRPGDRVCVSGQFFKVRGGNEPLTMNLEGFGLLQVEHETATASAATATVPAGVPLGQHNLTITTTTGVTTAGWPVQVAADQPQILGVQESEAVPGSTLHLFGRRFRSALERDASKATVWFGAQMVLGELGQPTTTEVDTLDTLSVEVPANLSGTQVAVQVQSTQGIRSEPVTVPLLAAPRVISMEAKAVAEDKVAVHVRVRGFTDPNGQRTASNQVRVGDTAVEFTVRRQGDREDVVVLESERPDDEATLTVELHDYQGRSTGRLATPIVVG